jgi:hypothetical protein
MKIDLKWEKPLRMKDGSKQNSIYTISGLDRIAKKPGVYVLVRRFGNSVVPLYVGQALKLKSRIEQQLNNVQLMMGLKNSPSGHRYLLVGRLCLHPGQQKEKVLDVVESALIKHALAQGHDLLNQQGTKTKVHVIRSKGNRYSKQIAPLNMLAERRND